MSKSDSSMKRASILAARVGAAGAAGWVLVSLGNGQGSAHLEFDTPSHVGHYLYGDANCTPNSQVQGTGDPINVVFWREGVDLSHSTVMGWMRDFAGFDNGGGKNKWFLDHGNCKLMDGQNATGSALAERFHARYLNGAGASWVLAPTHYEEIEWCTIPRHAVPDEEDYGFMWSGFLEARQRVVHEFSTEPGFSITFEWWGNWEQRPQCDNGEPRSDGWVAFIKAPPVLGGGCGGCGRAMPCS